MKHLYVIATRPDILKLSPVVKEIPGYVVHTGQHDELADTALKDIDLIPDQELKLMKKEQNIEDFISRCIPNLVKVIRKVNPQFVWVQGDTMSALCGALAGFLTQKKVVHLEAGLRSGDKYSPFPEEQTRIQIDHLVDIHLCPTYIDRDNLVREGIKDIKVTGNTIVDTLEKVKPTISNKRPFEEKYILATIHRRENMGEPMKEIFEALKEAPMNVIFPCHPNPKIRKIADKVGLEYTEPVDYKTLLWYLKHCEVVITDSGGIQEEAPSFGKKVLIARNNTERTDIFSTGQAKLVGSSKEKIKEGIKWALATRNRKQISNPFGDGASAGKIKKLNL